MQHLEPNLSHLCKEQNNIFFFVLIFLICTLTFFTETFVSPLKYVSARNRREVLTLKGFEDVVCFTLNQKLVFRLIADEYLFREHEC